MRLHSNRACDYPLCVAMAVDGDVHCAAHRRDAVNLGYPIHRRATRKRRPNPRQKSLW